jgi:hypothetical protein
MKFKKKVKLKEIVLFFRLVSNGSLPEWKGSERNVEEE